MKLTPTALTMLGFLHLHPRSGQELKQAADRSVANFWGISYGQIYPQLKQLNEAGLIAPIEDGSGTRGTKFALTSAGETELRTWLEIPADRPAYRDEFLVKVLFAERLLSPQQLLDLIERRETIARGALEQAESLEPNAEYGETGQHPHSDLIREFGIDVNRTIIDWCERAKSRLTSSD